MFIEVQEQHHFPTTVRCAHVNIRRSSHVIIKSWDKKQHEPSTIKKKQSCEYFCQKVKNRNTIFISPEAFNYVVIQKPDGSLIVHTFKESRRNLLL